MSGEGNEDLTSRVLLVAFCLAIRLLHLWSTRRPHQFCLCVSALIRATFTAFEVISPETASLE